MRVPPLRPSPQIHQSVQSGKKWISRPVVRLSHRGGKTVNAILLWTPIMHSNK